MPDQCTTCGAADVLLFTCGYCDRAFCADHSLPHHSCEGLAHPGEDAAEERFEWGNTETSMPDGFEWGDAETSMPDGFEWGDAETSMPDGFEWESVEETDEAEAGFAASGFRPASEGAEPTAPEPRPRVRAAPAVERVPRSPPDDTTTAIHRVPRHHDDDVRPAIQRVPRSPPAETTAAIRRVPRHRPEGAVAAVERVPRTHLEGTRSAVRCLPRRDTGPATTVVRPLPRRTTGPAEPAIRPLPATPEGEPTPAVGRAPPDPEPVPAATPSAGASTTTGSTSTEVPIRPMDTKRAPGRADRSDPRTLTEWLDQQTYVSLSVKTATLAAAINGALYLGMTLTMYGLPPV